LEAWISENRGWEDVFGVLVTMKRGWINHNGSIQGRQEECKELGSRQLEVRMEGGALPVGGEGEVIVDVGGDGDGGFAHGTEGEGEACKKSGDNERGSSLLTHISFQSPLQ
jgi:hypothetical protein